MIEERTTDPIIVLEKPDSCGSIIKSFVRKWPVKKLPNPAENTTDNPTKILSIRYSRE